MPVSFQNVSSIGATLSFSKLVKTFSHSALQSFHLSLDMSNLPNKLRQRPSHQQYSPSGILRFSPTERVNLEDITSYEMITFVDTAY